MIEVCLRSFNLTKKWVDVKSKTLLSGLPRPRLQRWHQCQAGIWVCTTTTVCTASSQAFVEILLVLCSATSLRNSTPPWKLSMRTLIAISCSFRFIAFHFLPFLLVSFIFVCFLNLMLLSSMIFYVNARSFHFIVISCHITHEVSHPMSHQFI